MLTNLTGLFNGLAGEGIGNHIFILAVLFQQL
jgi:hypothetical protein